MNLDEANNFLGIARLIRERLEKPRLTAWWLDVVDLTHSLEDSRRELLLPHWLEDFDDNLDECGTAKVSQQFRAALDPLWKPGKRFDPDCFRISHFLGGMKFAFCDPYQSMTFAGYETNFLGYGRKTLETEPIVVRPFEKSKAHFDDIRLDAIYCIEAWIRYVESQSETRTKERSRLDAYRDSFTDLVLFIDGMLEDPPEIENFSFKELNKAIDSEWIPEEVELYSAAWNDISQRLAVPLNAPSMFGIHAASFRLLVAEMAIGILDALGRGMDELLAGKPIVLRPRMLLDVRQFNRIPFAESEIGGPYSPKAHRHLNAEIERYRGWNLSKTLAEIKRFLDLEVGWVRRHENESRPIPPEVTNKKFSIVKQTEHPLGSTLQSEETATTTTGQTLSRDEFTPEDLPTGDWASILDVSPQSFRNRMSSNLPGATWRIAEVSSQRYIVHLDDLPRSLKSKPQRDDALNGKR